mmetsp:Transcript_27120/g.59253  ORF Transcript_27120/g.59253 Transcript_27120/m.59253 type:complete len:249 (+) Transcript_27120:713-1459(+)
MTWQPPLLLLVLCNVAHHPLHRLLRAERVPEAVRGHNHELILGSDVARRRVRRGEAPQICGFVVSDGAGHGQPRVELALLVLGFVKHPRHLLVRHARHQPAGLLYSLPLHGIAGLVVQGEELAGGAPVHLAAHHRRRVPHPRGQDLRLLEEHHRRRRPARRGVEALLHELQLRLFKRLGAALLEGVVLHGLVVDVPRNEPFDKLCRPTPVRPVSVEHRSHPHSIQVHQRLHDEGGILTLFTLVGVPRV